MLSTSMITIILVMRFIGLESRDLVFRGCRADGWGVIIYHVRIGDVDGFDDLEYPKPYDKP